MLKKYYAKYIVAFLILFLSVCTSKLQAQTADKVIPDEVNSLENPYDNDAKAIKRATKIYQKACWVCHGDNGIGNGPQSKDISTKVADFNDPIVRGRTDGALFWWIQTGGNDMEPFKDVLAEEEVWMLVAYIRDIQNL